MRSWVRAFVCAAAVTVTTGVARANFVQNGGFEAPNIGNVAFMHVPLGSTFITGWTVEAPTTTQGVDIITTRTGSMGAAHTGEQAIDMAGTPGRGSIFQDVATMPGLQYLLTFWVSSNGGPFNDGMSVEWNGVSQGLVDSPAFGTWEERSIMVTADATVTRLKFVGLIDGNQGVFLDDVCLTEVPEPASLLLVAGGLLALRRGRRA